MTGPRFELPSLPATSDGWGPSGPPPSLEGGVPYAPFSKGERLGRIADFTPSAYKHGEKWWFWWWEREGKREGERQSMSVDERRRWRLDGSTQTNSPLPFFSLL